MEIKKNEVWAYGDYAKEVQVPPIPLEGNYPEELATMKRGKLYYIETAGPLSCMPLLIGEGLLSSTVTREQDPRGRNTIALKEDECCWTCRYSYLDSMEASAKDGLENIRKEWDIFKKGRNSSDTDIITQSFGLTLDRNQKIRILDVNNNFSAAEKERAAGVITSQKMLHAAILQHAKILIDMAGYYTYAHPENQLTTENFSERVNYTTLLSQSNNRDKIHEILNIRTNAPNEYRAIDFEI